MGVFMTKILRALAAVLFLALAPLPAFAADVTVFGAASLADALKEIAANYKKASGKDVAVSLAASSQLARQIEASVDRRADQSECFKPHVPPVRECGSRRANGFDG